MKAIGNWARPGRNTAVAGLVMLAFVVMAAPTAWTATLDVPSTYPSLAAAAAACAAGDTINITGSYTDSGGSATVTGGRNNVTIQGNGHTVTCGAATVGGAICFKNVTGGVVQNLSINGAAIGQNLLFVDGSTVGGATSVTATNCQFYGSTNNGIRVANNSGLGATLVATGCRLYNNGGSGLALQQNPTATVSLCMIENNTQAGIIVPNTTSTLTVRDTVIRGNSSGASFGQVYYANTATLTHEFERCQIYGNSSVAVMYKLTTATGAVNLVLINCIIRRGTMATIPPQLINLGTTTQTVTMAHCTLLGAVSEYLFEGSATTLNATDTIFDSSAAGLGARNGALPASARPNIAWRAAGNTGFTSIPAGTINQNPNLLATGYLQAASLPALAAAAASSMALDVDNTARPKPASTPRDIGAHEAVFAPTVTTWPTASAITYGQTLGASTLTGGVYSPPGTFTFDSPATVPDAGTYDAAVTFTATNASFTMLSGTVPVTVNKAAATVTLGSLSPTYDGAPKSATATTAPAGLTVDFTYDGSPTPPTDAGSYTVVCTVNETNYQGSASGTLVIAKATPTATLSVSNSPVTYDGAAKAAAVGVTASSTPGAAQNVLTGGAAAQTAANTYAVTADFVPADTANYNTVPGLAAGDFVIAKATPTATLSVTNSPVTYDGAAKAATVAVTASSTPGTAQNVLTGGAAAQTAANTYAVTADFVPADTANYNTAPGLSAGDFVIAKATPTATLSVSNSPVTYDGAAKSAAVGIATSSVSGSVTNILTGGAASQTAAGTHAVTADFVPDDQTNYSTLASRSAGDFVINKAAATVTLGSLSPTYNGAPKPATAVTVPAGLTVDFTYDGSPTPPTAAGSYAVVGTIDETNYQGSASGTLVIAKAAITVTADAKTKSAGAPDPALTSQITSGALVSGDSLTGALTRAAGETAGTYAILQGTLTAGPNYDLTYAGANLTITAGGAFAVLYTGPNPVVAWVNDRVEIAVSAANHTGEVDYQWFKVSDKVLAPILGEITPTLVFGHAAYADAGSYVCEASNQGDTVQSPEIELVIEGTALPVAGGIGLAVAALAAALTGAGALRRRK